MEIVGYWDDEPVYGEKPEPISTFPFTAEGRRLERLEHELRLEQARLNVDRLQAKRREIEAQMRAHRRVPPR
jgi:hypothetical protein